MSVETFQARFAFVNTDDGTLTPEAFRVLRTWFKQIGGREGIGNDDLAQLVLQALGSLIVDSAARAGLADIELGQSVDQSSLITNMAQRIDELQLLASTVSSLVAEVASLRERAADIEQLASHRDPFRVDWERPGKIGSSTANSGAFTTLSASSGLSTGLVTSLVTSSVAMNNGAAAAAGTLANAPAAGNPTKWIPVNDNGTIRYIPAW